MSAGGWSKAGLGRLHDAMARHVADGRVSGVVTLVARHGEVHVDAIGATTVEGGTPMRRDTIFRISSMTKPITAVAAMILVEACKLRLDEPLDRFLPELAGRKVLNRLDGPLDDTTPARRSITLRDLLTFRMGFGIVFGPPDAYPILKATTDLHIGMGPPRPAELPAPDEWIRRLGTLPWMAQPGDAWIYNTAFDVLGVLIARASGQPFETFLQQRIFEPLGMTDTAFTVPASKRDRFLPSYWVEGEVYDPTDGEWMRAPAFPAGSAGLVSTVDDYLAFGQMLLNKGVHGRARILSRASVETMTTDQVTLAQKQAMAPFIPGFWDARGWGFGVAVDTQRDDLASVPGRFGWDGGLGTSWHSDPREGVVGVVMTQRAAFPQLSPLYLDFWTSTYAALDD